MHGRLSDDTAGMVGFLAYFVEACTREDIVGHAGEQIRTAAATTSVYRQS
jgi:hypothetical protein